MRYYQIFFSILMLATMVISCEKDEPTPITSPIEQPQGVLRAVAGNDTLIYFSNDYDFTLDGSKSVFPAFAQFREFSWKQLSGPSLLDFSGLGVKAYMNFMLYGTYVFELTIRNSTSVARDSVTVKVEAGSCNRRLEYIQAEFQVISEYGEQVPDNGSVTSSHGRLIIAGGAYYHEYNPFPQEYIHIFDIASQRWSTAKMTQPRYHTGMAANDRVAVIAGGINNNGLSDAVDIYEFATGKISSVKLSRARGDLNVSIIGNKAYLAGGSYFNGDLYKMMDIFDLGTGTFTTAPFPKSRYYMDATVVDNKIYYSGGLTSDYALSTSDINVYDVNNASWFEMRMKNGRHGHTGRVVDRKLFLLGGLEYNGWDSSPQNSLEMVDLVTSTAELGCLRAPWSLPFDSKLASATVAKNLYYLDNATLTRYDFLTGNWYVSKIAPETSLAGIFSDGTRLLGVGLENVSGNDKYTLKIYKINF